MKKKVLSVLLASALFAGSAIAVNAQVFGEWDESSQGGKNDEITALAFDALSYTVKNGEKKNLSEVLTAYAGKDKIVQRPDLEWSIDDTDLVFGMDTTDEEGGVIVSAFENSGTATVTVTANDGRVKTSVKVVAAPMTKATGFKFEKSSYKFPTGTYATAQDVKLIASPAGAKFDDEQIRVLESLALNAVATKDLTVNGTKVINKGDPIAASALGKANDDKNEITYTFAASDLSTTRIDIANAEIVTSTATVSFPEYNNNSKTRDITRDVKLTTTKAIQAERAARTGTMTIEVGQTKKLGDFVKFGPSDHNVKKLLSGSDMLNGDWTIEYYNDAATIDDFAVVDGEKVLGVAVGKVKAVTTFTNEAGDDKSIEVPIIVVPKGSLAVAEKEPEISETAVTLEVGGTYYVEVANAPDDAENITWTVDNDGATIVPESGAACKVFAKKAGTTKVTATYNGEEIGSLTVTVNAAGAVTPVVPTPDVEANPSTGDSLFAHLF